MKIASCLVFAGVLGASAIGCTGESDSAGASPNGKADNLSDAYDAVALFERVASDPVTLEIDAQIALETHVAESFGEPEASLQEFRVDWESLDCVSAAPSEFEPKAIGTCVINAVASDRHVLEEGQWGARLAIVQQQHSARVFVLNADFE